MNLSVILLALCQALLNSGNIVLISSNGLIGRELAPHEGLITLPIALQFVGLMAASLPASLIMQKIGRKRGFLLGNGFGLLGAVGCALALYWHSFALFSFCTFLVGIGVGFGMLYRFAALEACKPGTQSIAVSLVMAGGVISALVGPRLALHSQDLIPDMLFVGSFIGLAGLYLLAMLLLAFISIPAPKAVEVAGSVRPMREIMLQPVFIVAVTGGMISFTLMNMLMTAVPLAMSREQLPFSDVAVVMEWHVLGMYIPAFFTGFLIRRLGTVRVMQLGVLVMLGSAAVNLSGLTFNHFLFGLALVGLGWCFMYIAATQHLTGAYTEAEKGKVQGVNDLMVFGMVTVSALGSGWLESVIGWHNLNWFMLPLAVFAGLVITVLSRASRLQAAAEAG